MSAGKHRGNILINSVITLSMFVMVLMAVLYFYSINISIDNSQRNIEDGTYCLEMFKNIILFNYEYEDIEKILEGKTLYVNEESTKDIHGLSNNIESLLSPFSNNYPYIKIETLKEGKSINVIKIKAIYFYKGGSMKCDFYKGDYEKE